MNVETETKITEDTLGADQNGLSISVRHDNSYEYGFTVTLGCARGSFTSDDLRAIVKCFNRALKVRKDAA